jgi:hypothetical protein
MLCRTPKTDQSLTGWSKIWTAAPVAPAATGPAALRSLGLVAALGLGWLSGAFGQAVLPEFAVPGWEAEMALLNRMHALHQATAFSDCTLWDRWLPHASLWTGPIPRQRYRDSLLRRRMDSEGYVSMQQHRGMAHSEGWPFPAWQQSTGVGFHFSLQGEGWAVQNFQMSPLTETVGWELEGCEVVGLDPERGLHLRLTQPEVRVTTPPIGCGTIVAPFVRIEWAVSQWPDVATAHLTWRLEGETQWQEDRQIEFAPERRDGQGSYVNIPTYRHPAHAGILDRYRIQIRENVGSELWLKSFITAIDTRHPITNANYLRACLDYLDWTGDLPFLRANLARMRVALAYLIREFQLREHHHVIVPWVGHDGRSGIRYDGQGRKSLRPGLGVGNNYWDLLPFGGHDAMATLYAYDALTRMERLEATLATGPTWIAGEATEQANAPADHAAAWVPPPPEYSAAELAELALWLRTDFQSRFWDADVERFVGWIDLQGQSYDYGFTFLNLEAIAYGLASDHQARRILAWLDGERLIAEDTSQGPDLYRWRFGPRATTRRNIDTYVWAWSAPESIPWGGQVQDGGAVFGFSYYDLMARLRTRGPDDAWRRLSAILDWYAEVEQAGGYRSYYQLPGRGTLQGGGTAGGLGLDQEFFESVLVPQVMLYGFLGFQPTPDGYRLRPQLPAAWPSLTVSPIHFRHQVLAITAYADGTTEIKVLSE